MLLYVSSTYDANYIICDRLGFRGCKSLCELLFQSSNQLHYLDISCNELGDAGAACLADGISSLESLKVLKLGRNKVGNEGSQKIATAVNKIATLEEINLEGDLQHQNRPWSWKSKSSDWQFLFIPVFLAQMMSDSYGQETCCLSMKWKYGLARDYSQKSEKKHSLFRELYWRLWGYSSWESLHGHHICLWNSSHNPGKLQHQWRRSTQFGPSLGI